MIPQLLYEPLIFAVIWRAQRVYVVNINICPHKQALQILQTSPQDLWIYQQDMWGQGGFNNGWGQGGFNNNNNGWGQGGFNQGGSGFINLGGGGMGMGMGMSVSVAPGFNRWGSSCGNYQSMPGFTFVDYNNGWNPSYHDQLLRNNIDLVYSRYDSNFTGQLQGNEFFYAYRDLCLMMGVAPPMDYQSVWNAVLQCDSNFNGRVSKMEMFMMFKRIQGINMGMGFGY